MIQKLVQAAHCRHVSKGSSILVAGEIAQEFIIIKNGSFKLNPPEATSSTQQSLEARLAHSAVTERLARKQQFLLSMSMQTAHDMECPENARRKKSRRGRASLQID